MTTWKTMADIRREYGQLTLDEETINHCPITQFECWFAEVIETEKSDPTAMVLSTINEQGHPDSRVVLLKGIYKGSFVFYTNYASAKAIQIKKTPYVALNFYWPEMARQVRIRGPIKRVSETQSDTYFLSRPRTSQLSAIISAQSSEIKGRAELEDLFKDLNDKYKDQSILRPANWGGYMVMPEEMEFWQGRDDRLHDRIHYYLNNGKWLHRRLAP